MGVHSMNNLKKDLTLKLKILETNHESVPLTYFL